MNEQERSARARAAHTLVRLEAMLASVRDTFEADLATSEARQSLTHTVAQLQEQLAVVDSHRYERERLARAESGPVVHTEVDRDRETVEFRMVKP